jgi:hypothetical protein
MLMMERPIVLGDWIKVNNETGIVAESNWRAIHLRTRSNSLVVVPNSALAKESFTNFSRPDKTHCEPVTLSFSPDDAPNRVKRVLLEAGRRTRGVLAEPAPEICLKNFRECGIEYEVSLSLADYAHADAAAHEFRTLVWYAARREGLTITYPNSALPASPVQPGARAASAGGSAPGGASGALDAFPHLGVARGGAVPEVFSRGFLRTFADGEQIVKEGERLSGLHLIVNGRVSLSALDSEGRQCEIARLERGEFFGEKALLSSITSDVTATAAGDAELLLLEGDAVLALIEQTPYLSQQIGGVVEARRRALQKTREPQGVAGD